MSVINRATGKEVEDLDDRELVTANELRRRRAEQRSKGSESNHDRDLEAIARRREEAAEKQVANDFERAAQSVSYANPEINAHPGLKQRFMEETLQEIHRAATNREVIDWHSKMPEIANKVRAAGGLPTVEERGREEVLDEMRKDRGQ